MKNFLFLSVLLFSQCVFGQFGRPRVISACELCSPRYFQLVDFDYDGDKDILTTSISDNKVVWYRNDGGGVFSSQLLITKEIRGAFQATSADFDGDKDMDVIAVSPQDKNLAFYKNNGQFNFSEKSIIDSSITNLEAVAVTDLNGDQFPDIVVSSHASLGPTVWYKNDGKGNFSKRRLISPTYTGYIHTADLDGDGDQDVLLETYWYANDGHGNFTEMTQDVFGTGIYATTADLNNDQRLDIITAAYNPNSGYYDIFWYKNEGNGQFSNPVRIDPGNNSIQFALGDLDNDGDLDFASTRGNELRWKKNDGTGNFGASQIISTSGATSVQAAYIDGDQRVDLITASMQNGDMTLYSNNPNLTFNQRPIVKNLTNGSSAVHSGDFDNDGHTDVLVASALDHKVSWFKNDGQKGFSEQIVVTDKLRGANSINAADFDKDGDLDVIASGLESVYYYRNAGKGLFSEPTLIYYENPNFRQHTRVSIGDIDRDGNLDVFYMAYRSGGYYIYWHKNDGKGNFGAAKYVIKADLNSDTAVPSFCAADLDNDGDLDMVTPFDNIPLLWLSNDGAGNFSGISPTRYVTSYRNSTEIFPTDFDGDSDLDILSDHILYWHENGGNGRFYDQQNSRYFGLHPVTTANIEGTRFVSVGDLDMDGDQDVVVATDRDRKLSWYRNNGRGVFSKSIPIATGTEPARPLHLVDLDKDGDLDIITSYEFTDKVIWYENVEPLPAIEGLVFWDKNENGKYDSTEQVITNLPVTISPEAISSYTDYDGKFRFFVPNGQYQVSVQTGACWEVTQGALSYSVYINNNVVDTLLFALKVKSQDPRPQATIHSGPTRCGFRVPFWLSVQNAGCGVGNGHYAVVLSPLVKLISAKPAPIETRGDTLFWQYSDLAASQIEQVAFLLQVAGTEFLGDSIRLKALAWLEKSPGVFDAPRISTFSSEIRCAYDPNDKLVLPNRAPLYTQNYTLFNETLEYTIRFQNTGNDTAFTVVIRDTLAQNLDWRTFQIGASSHPVEIQLTEGGVLKFTFRNILLPDSTTNEQWSHGFVSFRIAPKTGLPEKTPLRNSASIYFDFNPPIKTNSTNSVMVSVLPKPNRTESAQEHSPLLVFPNPFYDRLYIQYVAPNRNLDGHHLQLWNGQGQLVLTQQIAGKIANINLPNLAAGLYFYVLIDQNAKPIWSGKIIRR